MGATEHGVELAPLTTMRVGGPADTLVTAETLDEVVAAVRAADEVGTPLLLLSGGSNLVIADDGFRGTVVRIATKGVRVESTHDEHVDVVLLDAHHQLAVVEEQAGARFDRGEDLAMRQFHARRVAGLRHPVEHGHVGELVGDPPAPAAAVPQRLLAVDRDQVQRAGDGADDEDAER